MPARPINVVKSAIHKSAAGRTAATVRPEDAPSAVRQDLAVMSQQAQQYELGAAAGTADSAMNLQATTERLAQDRADQDERIREQLEIQAQDRAEAEVRRQAAAEAAAQAIELGRLSSSNNVQAANRQADRAVAETGARAAAARAEAARAAQDQSDKLAAEAAEARRDAYLFRLAGEQPIEAVEQLDAIVKGAGNVSEALAQVERLRKSNRLGSGAVGQDARARQTAQHVIDYYRAIEGR